MPRPLRVGVAVESKEAGESLLKRLWWVFATASVISIGFGLVLLAWPKATVTVFGIITGLAMIWFGLAEILYGTVARGAAHWWIYPVRGVVGLALGITLVAWPGRTILVITVLVGLFMIFSGIIELFLSIATPDLDHRALAIVFSVLTIAAGLLVRSFPVESIRFLTIVWGAFLVLFGTLDFISALQHRRLGDDVDIIVV
jgi:uncharacterized membrane protein HdeD (DUF308 family)